MRIVNILGNLLILTGAAIALVLMLHSPKVGAFAQRSEPRADDMRKIQQLLDDQQTAWNRGAIDAFLQGYWHSQALTFSGSGGIERGWDGVRARYRRNYPEPAAMGQLDFSGLEFRFLGPDAAFVLGRWHLTRAKGEIGGVFSLVLQRFPEGWKIVHDHTSIVPPPEK